MVAAILKKVALFILARMFTLRKCAVMPKIALQSRPPQHSCNTATYYRTTRTVTTTTRCCPSTTTMAAAAAAAADGSFNNGVY
jgi:hypothetical protein